MPITTGKPILYIIINNHFDLTWRRCWQRPFSFRDQIFVSYTDIEEYYMLDNIELTRQNGDYKFEAESVMVVRKFIERHPAMLPVLQELSREARFAVTGGGESIVDANMIHGESLLRNYVDGLLWVEETFGQKTHLGVRNDAFGNSAQLPQILRGCEIKWAVGMSYSPAEGLYWRGLDGSVILHRTLPVAAWGGGVEKYPPCPECHGEKKLNQILCFHCDGRGIEPSLRAALPGRINPDLLKEFGAGLVLITPEELLPNPALLDWVEEMRKEYDVRYSLAEETLPYVQSWLDGMDDLQEEDIHPAIELNPNNSGCLVTRIKTKQEERRLEHALMALESLSVMATLKGKDYPAAELKKIWQNAYFTMFHDAITATHVDAAYAELMDIITEIDEGTNFLLEDVLSSLSDPGDKTASFSVINPGGESMTDICKIHLPYKEGFSILDEHGQRVKLLSVEVCGDETIIEFLAVSLAPFSCRQYQVSNTIGFEVPLQTTDEAMIENARFRVSADEHGLVSVFDKKLNTEILSTDGYRPGELILEHDEGSPWATLHPDFSRIPLSTLTKLAAVEKKYSIQRLIFIVETPWQMGFAGNALKAKLTVSLVEGLDRVDFKLDAEWNTFNYRLRVAMPVPVTVGEEPRHLYEIPYGVVERKPYTPTFHWAGANGDWPAIHWAGVEQTGMSVALLNQGTPSYRIEKGASNTEVILLSLLRSPAIPTYLHEPQYYSMTDWDGMRDAGSHTFAFAIHAYDGVFSESNVVLDGEAYCTPLIAVQGGVNLPKMPTVQSEAVRLSAVKWAESGDGLVLRLVEYHGKGGQVIITLPWPVKFASKVNLLERQAQELLVMDNNIRFTLRPWEIATIKFDL